MPTDVATDPVTEPEIPFADPDPAEMPVEVAEHLARCVACDVRVRYAPNAIGTGFTLTAGSDLSFGVGPNGRPTCPNGHGEMEIADDAIPVAEAIDEVARLQEAQQVSLPGILPVFNYQGAYLELETQAIEVDRLHDESKDAATEAREAKQRWDKAAELYTKMAIEFQRRRREKVAAGEPVTDVDPARCTFEQMHPDQTCPICADPSNFVDAAAPTSALHADDAEAWLADRATAELCELLDDAVQHVVPDSVVRGWTDDQRAEVTAYAVAVRDEIDPLPARPACLGRPHVVAKGITSEVAPGDTFVSCEICDARLRSVKTGEGETLEAYAPGWLVGVDCKGKAPDVEHHYTPKRSKAAPKAKTSAKPRRKK